MEKIKIHELAKNINLSSKEVIEKATELGIVVKNHLSAISEDEAQKITKALKRNNDSVKKDKKQKDSNDSAIKKENKKEEKPVIIRREVIIDNEEENNKKEKRMEQQRKNDIGFVEANRKTDFNIVYRNKQTKPLTVDELFGIKKEAPKNQVEETKKEVKEEVKEMQKEETDINKKAIEEKPAQQLQNRGYVERNNQNQYNNQNQRNNEQYNRPNSYNNRPNSYNNDNNRPNQYNNRPNSYNNDNSRPNQYNNRPNSYNNDNSRPNQYNNNRPNQYNNRPNNNNYANNTNNNNNFNRPRNQYNNTGNYNNSRDASGSDNRPNNFNNRRTTPYNNNNRNRNNNERRPLDNYGIEKNIKNIMAADVVEKENVREYQNKVIDKQKSNTRFEDSKAKKQAKTRKTSETDISTGKLKDLKQVDKLSNMFVEGEILDYYDLTTQRGRKNKKKIMKGEKEERKQKIFKLTDITIPESITVKDLATELKKTSGEIIKKLFGFGIMATINNEIDFDTAFLIAQEFGITAHKKEVLTEEDILFDDSQDTEDMLMTRPPVVVVMGHVDHGKTSLLDAIRKTNVIEGEAGGITQHIGAYKVKIDGRDITFLDTPGHEAFTSMRARGAQVTDIAILVVAANDGVMPQTIEAINHAKAANIPIVVAVNKIDLEGANVEKIKQDLTEYELVPEEWGGDTIFVPISAKLNQNIDTLLEMVLLVADMKELKANPNKQAKGTVIEAKLDKNRGPIATVLVQRGTLDIGDTVIVGSTIGRIRQMINDKGQKVKKAGPSTPVEITGLTTVPEGGDVFYEVKDEKTAKQLIEKRKREERDKYLNCSSKITLENLFNVMEQSNIKQLNLIVKADVQGSVEAVKQSLEKLSTKEIKVKVIHANVGSVTESDVNLANVANAIVIAFNVPIPAISKSIAEKSCVEVKQYNIIYKAIEDVERAMKGMAEPVYEEKRIGTVEVRQIFKVSNIGTIAGCYVTDGKAIRNSIVKVIRDGNIAYEGKIETLKRFKDDVKEVTYGYECGIEIEDYNDIHEGDILEIYIMEEIKN